MIRQAALFGLGKYLSAILFVVFCGTLLGKPARDAYSLVDPRIGTAHDGQTYPVVGLPFGMTGWTPETQPTENKCLSPYYYKAEFLTGFRGSHWLSGTCTQDYGSVTLMPVVGSLRVTPKSRAARFRHASEQMSPAFYSVNLPDEHMQVALTGTLRTGFMRVRFPQGQARHLVVDLNVHPGKGYVEVRPAAHEIVGYNPVIRMYQGAGQPAGFSGFFAVRFRENVGDFGTWCDEAIHSRKAVESGGCGRLGAYVSIDRGPAEVLVKIGTSFTSIDEAERNLEAENPGWDFAKTSGDAARAWRAVLDRIEVHGGTEAQQKIFYTALFHASLAPRVISDADGSYDGFGQEGRVHKLGKGEAYYDDFSLWDTFRSLHPLLTILDPKRNEQMVQSLVLKGEQGGFLPIFPTWNSYTSEMIGDHAVPVIVDAYAKGQRGFDVEGAWRLVRRNAFELPPHDEYVEGKGRRALDSYLRYGYIPLEDEVLDAFHRREQVSRTLEYAYDDFIAAQFAESLGHVEDARLLMHRSGNWRNVFDPTTGFVRGRHADGSWVTPFDPRKSAPYITEGVPWQYTFFVPQDVAGLITAEGGRQAFVHKLDGLFDAHLYDQGNEPSHAIAYLYVNAGAPWKTQERIREIMQTQYMTGPSGLPGNDDAGQMSAWFVFSAMGFFPSCPGIPKYTIGSPIFSKIVIHQQNGRDFTILAPGSSPKNIYIREASLNGEPLKELEFRHEDIMRGGTLVLRMSPKPSTATPEPSHVH